MGQFYSQNGLGSAFNTQLIDALIEYYQAVKANLTTGWKAMKIAGDSARRGLKGSRYRLQWLEQ